MPNRTRSFIPGLVSVSFRNRSAAEVIALAAGAGLKSIEWGADVHVPPGDPANASRIRELCDQNGIGISAYGSYYRAGPCEINGSGFDSIVATSRELGADTIRVWAGNLGSAEASTSFRDAMVADLKRICRLAAQANCLVSLEFHGGTLTDSAEGTCRLIDDVGMPNLSTYWQPPVGMSKEDCLSSLRMVLPHLGNIHVFHWWPDQHHRLPLADGIDRWREYLKLAESVGAARHASLEFVRGDDPAQLADDAKTFLNLLNAVAEV